MSDICGDRPRKIAFDQRGLRFFHYFKYRFYITLVAMLMPISTLIWNLPAQAQSCEYWVAPTPQGNNSSPGTVDQPWATLEHAAQNVPDNNCTVWFKAGLYVGKNDLDRRFTTPTTFKAVQAYRSIFENNGPVIDLDGVRNVILEGFEFRQSGPNPDQYLVIADRSGDLKSENIIFRNNIFHDSYNNDLLKIHNGVRFATVENNIFYNQADSEQHIDVNSVTDVVVQDNIFFNDFAGSGRSDTKTTKHFIVIKDSNENSDGLEGSERITVRRNIFLNWEGGSETFVQVGNDGKPYHEAEEVLVTNNLMIGNGPDLVYAVFGVRGAKNVTFSNNTVTGNLPADKAYAFYVSITELNPKNENIYFYNNIWSDPTGTMGSDLSGNLANNRFSSGNPEDTLNLKLNNNLYWNGDQEIPAGPPVSPLANDPRHLVGNPLLNPNQNSIILPRWNGSTFLSGNRFIRQEFVRLVEQYGQIPPSSPAIDKADPSFAPAEDILSRSRGASPDLGAYEHFKANLLYLPVLIKKCCNGN